MRGLPFSHKMQKPRLLGRGFCNKKRGEEKMKKMEVIYIIDRPVFGLDVVHFFYGFIIPIKY